MTTLLTTFLLSLLLAYLLTPLVSTLARRLGIVDRPAERKVHERPIPRAGGVAIYLAFMLPFLAAVGVQSVLFGYLTTDLKLLGIIIGGTLVFAIGLWDDVRPLPARVKLGAQTLAALIAYASGVQIVLVALPGLPEIALGWLSVPLTLAWFLLIINALNLIDGLDGLAAGITLFTALVLLIVWETAGSFLVAIGLAALAGAALGFLRYNFNPASIFLGDGGSYFLGFNLAALSVLGAIKSEATVAILIPVIALGVPLMDAIWAPIRRFILGQRLFHPDMDHIHHRLLKLGYTHRRAVLTLYGITIVMGVLALSLVHARDDRAALILVLVGGGVITSIRRLGYLGYIHRGRFIGWLGTVSDELGLRRNRRSFLECQVQISESATLEELWDGISSAAHFLDIDYCELKLDASMVPGNGCSPGFRLLKEGRRDPTSLKVDEALHISLPLVDGTQHMGSLVVAQEVANGFRNPYFLRRIDQLRGTVLETLGGIRERTQKPHGTQPLHATRGPRPLQPSTSNGNGSRWARHDENPFP